MVFSTLNVFPSIKKQAVHTQQAVSRGKKLEGGEDLGGCSFAGSFMCRVYKLDLSFLKYSPRGDPYYSKPKCDWRMINTM